MNTVFLKKEEEYNWSVLLNMFNLWELKFLGINIEIWFQLWIFGDPSVGPIFTVSERFVVF